MAVELVEHRLGLALSLERHGEQARWLIHRDEIVVFVEDVEIAGPVGCRPPLRAAGTIHPDADAVAGGQPLRGVGCRRLVAVDEDLPALDGGAGPAARPESIGCSEKFIETK